MYRKDLERYTYTAEEALKEDYPNYIEESEVKGVLDDIENIVNNIKDMLEPIQGLSIIDEVKEMLETLSKDLY